MRHTQVCTWDRRWPSPHQPAGGDGHTLTAPEGAWPLAALGPGSLCTWGSQNHLLRKGTGSWNKSQEWLGEAVQSSPFLGLLTGPIAGANGASLVAQMVKRLPAMRETQVRSLGWEDPLKKGLTSHSSILGRIPWTKEPGGLYSTGSQRVEHD